MEKQIIVVNKPNKISKENVETIILNKTLTFKVAKIIIAASMKDTTAIKTHSKVTIVTTFYSAGVINIPMAKTTAKAMIKPFKIMLRISCF